MSQLHDGSKARGRSHAPFLVTALAWPSAARTSAAAKAKELAAKAINRLVDPAAPAEEKASRKRRLIKGPEEFQEVRVDGAKPK
jgi:hypothetical protein